MSAFQNLDPAGVSPEDRINALRGYKATINNPRVSEEAKQHAHEMIDSLGGDQPRAEMKQFDQQHDQNRVAGGLKAYVFALIILSDMERWMC
ncbi:conidiation protein Con-6, putative [Talaromyces stipitatus ATCC 10500]|uniref:Conidiation protein Con-6, putative n=1 Tax=Talaromyces stipitatus (strain ATCC 10500 / CBS 375.48 / QM 6759 / NRRL 1006) TaxID=441959 RepID=B8M7S9_TALSN|nr:conidiation protein Con-6, putative [Talaromyces stipitatus ATCC 10500]EED19808.1 conidiation protein Con-6, putative [Talaromyces stipitatus ATCC 10500]